MRTGENTVVENIIGGGTVIDNLSIIPPMVVNSGTMKLKLK